MRPHTTHARAHRAHADGTLRGVQPSKSSGAAAFNDRFVLSVQLGTGAVQWTLMLDGMRPECAPDIIFDEGSEDFSATLEYAELEAIKTWDVTRETALLELLQELHGKFLTHQHTRVQTFSDAQVKFELESIMAHAPHAQLRFVNDKDRTVECVVPIYHGPEVAAATRASSSSATPSACAERQVCRLVLVLDQAMKAVHSALQYPPSTPPTQVRPRRLRRTSVSVCGGATRVSEEVAVCGRGRSARGGSPARRMPSTSSPWFRSAARARAPWCKGAAWHASVARMPSCSVARMPPCSCALCKRRL